MELTDHMAQPSTQSAPRQAGAVQPGVVILMAVYNGAPYLAEQLASLARQHHRSWRLVSADDGSQDDSRRVLEDFARAGHSVAILDGPKAGPAQNFLGLIRAAPQFLAATDWLAFSDQDDVWTPERLSAGLVALTDVPADRPAMAFGKTFVTDAELGNPRLSAPRPRPPGFRNALVQNIAAGNTLLLNPAAARLICAAAMEIDDLVIHDWWIYQIVTGAGGVSCHIEQPLLYYRQHSGNSIGANDSLRASLYRLWRMLRGDFRQWNSTNIAALEQSWHRLTPENQSVLHRFATARQQGALRRMLCIRNLGLYRQSRSGQISLWLAALMNRL
jgi:glycosyltransferase involved in cell wall biosynthesis